MRKLIVVAGLMLLWTQAMEAQCTGYSANVTYTPLSPADAAQRGQVTATLAVTATDSGGNPINGAAPSHNLKVGNTWITFNYNFSHAVSWSSYYTINSDPTHYDTGFTGSSHQWFVSNADNGDVWNVYVIATDANGNTTQDRVTVIAGTGTAPTIINQDGMFTNIYVEVTINFGGGSMMNNCTECNTNPRACVNATHTPYVTMTAVNHTTGESQSLPRQQAGNIANSTSSISGTGSIFISASSPNDTIDGTAEGEILCSMFGDLPINGNDDWHIQWEWAWTKVSTIQNTCVEVPQMGGGVRCNVTSQYTVSQACAPPDLRPTTVYSNLSVSGMPVTPATMPPFWWTWSLGIRPRVTSFPWFFPFSDLGAILQKDYWVTKLLAGAFPSNGIVRDATNYDKGCGVPSPFPPFDQP